MSEGLALRPPSWPSGIAQDKARRVRMVLTDVDGVLTSSQVIYDASGARHRAFSTRDGAAIQWLSSCGIPVGFLSALDDPSIRKRGEDLGVASLRLGHTDKLAAFHSILESCSIHSGEIAYLGDDLVDLPVLAAVGFSACPADAAPEVQAACTLVLPQKGGEGCFRAAAEIILKAQGHWAEILGRYFKHRPEPGELRPLP